MKTKIGLLTAIVVVVSALGTGLYIRAQAPEVEVLAYWPAPTTGSPVELYHIESNTTPIGGEPEGWELAGVSVDTFHTLPRLVGDTVYRVAGMDALGRLGPWSESSDPFHDDGPPGQAGKVKVTAVVE